MRKHERRACECGPRCDNCGSPERDHLGAAKLCPGLGNDPDYTWTPGALPETTYHETHAQTHWSPAEGDEVCTACGGAR